MQHGGDRVGIVGGELRIDAVALFEQLAGIGDVADIGRGLAGEHREAVEPQHLGALDLGVPVGALDQPHHQPAVELVGERLEPVDDVAGALAIGLHHDAEAVPAGKALIGEDGRDDIERQVEPVGFLGIDVEAHIGAARHQRQRQRALDQFVHDAVALGMNS